MKVFDFVKAKKGEPVCLVNGEMCRIICYDKEGVFPIVVLVKTCQGEIIMMHDEYGYCADKDPEHTLCMYVEKKNAYVVIYKEHNTSSENGYEYMSIESEIYDDLKDANDAIVDLGKDFIKMVEVSYEE